MRAAQERLAAWFARIGRIRQDYRQVHGRGVHLLRPRRYTEKVQWRKLFDSDPRHTLFCDKLRTRDLLAARYGAELLPPLLWSGGVEGLAAALARLAPPYVLKSSHASGHLVLVEKGERPDVAALIAQAAGWLARNHGRESNERGYIAVPPRLLIERMVRDAAGGRPDEQRVFVFGGQARIVNTVFIEEGAVRNGAFHTPGWQRLNWHFSRVVERPFAQPPALAEMLRIAESLGEGIDHLRVDFFDGGARFWIGEVTLYPWSGMARFRPDEADHQMGALWPLRHPARRAITALLRDQPEGNSPT